MKVSRCPEVKRSERNFYLRWFMRRSIEIKQSSGDLNSQTKKDGPCYAILKLQLFSKPLKTSWTLGEFLSPLITILEVENPRLIVSATKHCWNLIFSEQKVSNSF